MGRAWGSQLQIPFGPQHRPDGKEEAADLLVGVGWGASVSKLQEKPAQLLTAKKNLPDKTQQAFPLGLSLCWMLRLETMLLLTEEFLMC